MKIVNLWSNELFFRWQHNEHTQTVSHTRTIHPKKQCEILFMEKNPLLIKLSFLEWKKRTQKFKRMLSHWNENKWRWQFYDVEVFHSSQFISLSQSHLFALVDPLFSMWQQKCKIQQIRKWQNNFKWFSCWKRFSRVYCFSFLDFMRSKIEYKHIFHLMPFHVFPSS